MTPAQRRTTLSRLHVPLLLLVLCAPPVLAVDGLDDPGGYSSTPFDLDLAKSDYARACAAQPDGKVIMAGSATDDDGEETKIAIARLTLDGLLDDDFGFDVNLVGRVVLTLSEHGIQATQGQVRALAVDSQGRILVAGSMVRIDNDESIGYVTRLLSDGWVDPLFPPAGWYLDFGMTGVTAMGFDAAGYLWLVGPLVADGSGPWVVTVLDQYGDFVVSETVSFASWGFETSLPTALAFQPDGKVLLGGWGTRGEPSFHTSFALTRFLALSLVPDQKFGSGSGQLVLDYLEPARLRSIALQPDGHIVVAGEHGDPGAEDVVVTRLSSTGSILGGFTNYVAFDLITSGSDGGAGFNRMVVQSDGKILVAASVVTGDVKNVTDVGVARILSTGGFDNPFAGAGSGKRTFDMPPYGSSDGNDTFGCLTLSGGKAVLVGAGRFSGLDWDFSFRRLTSELVFTDGFESASTYSWTLP